MTDLEAALIEVASALDSCGLPYMLIGGLAVTAWGVPRSTLDVDVTVWADPPELPRAVGCICERLQSGASDPLGFVNETRVLPLISHAGVRIDVVFGVLALQRESIRRAVLKTIAGREIPIVSIEDLILMKLISEREKDIADARALLRRFRKSLDRGYLLPKLEELANALSAPDILEIFRTETS